MTGEQGTVQISDGKISGKTVSWTVATQIGGRSVTVSYQGEVEGDRMSGSVAFGGAGSASFTAERRP
jgi:hypothetical protein